MQLDSGVEHAEVREYVSPVPPPVAAIVIVDFDETVAAVIVYFENLPATKHCLCSIQKVATTIHRALCIEAASRFPAASASSKLSNMTHPLGGLLASTAIGAPPFQFARHLSG
jgi:hypothetical protein